MRRAQDWVRSARSRKNGARSATIKSRALGALKLASEAMDENVPAKRADFFIFCYATRLLSQLRLEILELVLEVCCSLIGQRVFKEEKK